MDQMDVSYAVWGHRKADTKGLCTNIFIGFLLCVYETDEFGHV